MSDDEPEPTLNVNYIKAHEFREVSVDGVLGGPTPHGKFWMCLYSERLPVPQVVRHKLIKIENTEDFQIDTAIPGTPIEGRTGIVRNLEVGVYLSFDAAEEIHKWLGEQLVALGRYE